MPVDIAALWDYDRPAESEQRFRDALATTTGDDALSLRTQIARALGLRDLFDEAYRELDALEPLLASAGAEPRVRALLERGRTLRSSGHADEARPLFERAFGFADAAGLAGLAADALHMLPLVEPTLDGQLEGARRLIAYARASSDPAARYWEAPGLNNLGVSLNEAGRHEGALDAFHEALAARGRIGRPEGIRIAQWMIANTLRKLGRHDEALAIQLDLETQFEAAGQPDPYVFEELAILYEARGDAVDAERCRDLQRRATPE